MRNIYSSAEAFNAAVPVGSPVRYWPVASSEAFRATRTRTVAWELGGGHPVVCVEGESGGVSLAHVQVIAEPMP